MRANRETASLAQTQDNVNDLPALLVAVALHEDDLAWAQAYCLALADHPNENVRGNAILGFGHLARRFGTLAEQAKPAIERGLLDTSAFVRGQAVASADDVSQFLGWHFPDN